MCGSLACEGGVHGVCNTGEGVWAFRKVQCAPQPTTPDGSISGKLSALTLNIVEKDYLNVGDWGGICTCPVSLRLPPLVCDFSQANRHCIV